MVAVLLRVLFDNDAPASARLDAADLIFRYAKTASETEEGWAPNTPRKQPGLRRSVATDQNPTPNKDAALVALLTKRNVQEAAHSIGMGVQTLYRWLQDPGFTFAYLEARMDGFGQAGARLQQIAPKAATTMQNIAGDARTPASLKVRAVALALGYAQAASDEDIEMYIAESDSARQATVGRERLNLRGVINSAFPPL